MHEEMVARMKAKHEEEIKARLGDDYDKSDSDDDDD